MNKNKDLRLTSTLTIPVLKSYGYRNNGWYMVYFGSAIFRNQAFSGISRVIESNKQQEQASALLRVRHCTGYGYSGQCEVLETGNAEKEILILAAPNAAVIVHVDPKTSYRWTWANGILTPSE